MASSGKFQSGPPRQRGQGMVEAIVTIPVFLLLVFGLFQLFLISIAQVQLVYAAFCAARVGSVRNADIQEMEAAAKRVLFGPASIIPGVAAACRVEKLLPVQSPPDKPGRLSKEPVEIIKIRVYWDYPLSVPVPVVRPAGIVSGGIFSTVGSIPLQASWITVNFGKQPGTGEGEDNVRK